MSTEYLQKRIDKHFSDLFDALMYELENANEPLSKSQVADIISDSRYDLWNDVEAELESLYETMEEDDEYHTDKVRHYEDKINEQEDLIRELEDRIATWE